MIITAGRQGATPLVRAADEILGTHKAAARWDRLVASYRAQHAADQQAKIDTLLLETIDALASLLLSSHHPGNGTA